MRRQLIIGIDPGKGGGLALADAETGAILSARPMPRGATESDAILALGCAVNGYTSAGLVVMAYIERMNFFGVGQKREENDKGAIKSNPRTLIDLARHVGQIEAVLAMRHVPRASVYPVTWQANIAEKLPKDYTERKRRLKELAEPHYTGSVTLAISDAIHIARYGVEHYKRNAQDDGNQQED